MGTPEEVQNEIEGAAPHHEMLVWPGTPWEAVASSLQDKTTRHAAEWLRAHQAYDVGRPDTGEEKAWVGPFDMLSRLLFEVTLWLPPLPETALLQKFGQPETVVGYARDAVSWLKVVNDKLEVALARLEGGGAPNVPSLPEYGRPGQLPQDQYPPDYGVGQIPWVPEEEAQIDQGLPYEPPGAAHQPWYPPEADSPGVGGGRPPFRPNQYPARVSRDQNRPTREPVWNARSEYRSARSDYRQEEGRHHAP